MLTLIFLALTNDSANKILIFLSIFLLSLFWILITAVFAKMCLEKFYLHYKNFQLKNTKWITARKTENRLQEAALMWIAKELAYLHDFIWNLRKNNNNYCRSKSYIGRIKEIETEIKNKELGQELFENIKANLYKGLLLNKCDGIAKEFTEEFFHKKMD